MPDGRTPIPPPVGGTERPSPTLAEGRPRPGDLLMQLGGARTPQTLGNTQQAIQLVLSAADQLMQAAAVDPTIASVVQDTIRTLQTGLSGLGGRLRRRPTRRRTPAPEFGEGETEAGTSPTQPLL